VHSSSTLVGSPHDIACPGACSASYHLNSPVSLTATPAWYSSVSWSGADSSAGSGALVNLNSSRSVTASFSQNPNARLLPDSSFGSLQLAYNAAAPSGGALQAKNSALVIFTERLTCDQPYTVSISGGKSETFSPTSGYSLIQGELRISKGRVNVSGIKLHP